MSTPQRSTTHAHSRVRILSIAGAVVVVAALSLSGSPASASVVAKIQLGTTEQFGVLGGQTVTNTGSTVINGLDVGVSPGTAVTGFPPGQILAPGVLHAADGVAGQAQSDAITAYNQAAGLPADNPVAYTQLGGKKLAPGVYQGNLSLTGTVTLDNSDDPDAVFVFQASSTLITATSSVVAFSNPDHPSCNVFWQVGSSATLGAASTFVGTIDALTTVTLGTFATVQGRVIARNGAVNLKSNRISRVPCADAEPPTTPSTPSTSSSSSTPSTPSTPSTSSSSGAPSSSTPSTPSPPSTSVTRPTTTRSTPTTRSVPTTTTIPRDITTGQSLTIVAPSTTTTSSTRSTTSTRTSTTSPSTDTSTQVLTSTEVYGGGTTDYTESMESTEALGIDTGSGGTLANTGPAQVKDLLALGLSLLGGGLAVLFFAGRRMVQPGRHRQI